LTLDFENLQNSYLITILVLFILCSITRVVLKLVNQNWINTYSHSLTIFILPVVTYVITSVISTNIALSLCLVGALSIVRFRHPVRSPLELGIYFYLIGLGISASVNIKWTLLLGGSILSLLLIFYLMEKFLQKFSYNLFSNSFTEGNILNTLEITSGQKIEDLHTSDYLINIEKENDIFFYRFASSNKKHLASIFEKYENKKYIKKIIFSS